MSFLPSVKEVLFFFSDSNLLHCEEWAIYVRGVVKILMTYNQIIIPMAEAYLIHKIQFQHPELMKELSRFLYMIRRFSSQTSTILYCSLLQPSQPATRKKYDQPGASVMTSPTSTGDSSSLVTAVVAPPLPGLTNETHYDVSTGKTSSNENAETSMALIVDKMLPDLIDVCVWGAGTTTTATANGSTINGQNEQLKQLVSKSFQSNRLPVLPDSGTPNLSSLLSGRPISAEICHFVAHTASELSRLLIDEIKIVHKEDLVVTFE